MCGTFWWGVVGVAVPDRRGGGRGGRGGGQGRWGEVSVERGGEVRTYAWQGLGVQGVGGGGPCGLWMGGHVGGGVSGDMCRG